MCEITTYEHNSLRQSPNKRVSTYATKCATLERFDCTQFPGNSTVHTG